MNIMEIVLCSPISRKVSYYDGNTTLYIGNTTLYIMDK